MNPVLNFCNSAGLPSTKTRVNTSISKCPTSLPSPRTSTIILSQLPSAPPSSTLSSTPESPTLPLSAFKLIADALINDIDYLAFSEDIEPLLGVQHLLANHTVANFLILASRSDPFNPAFAEPFKSTPQDLTLLRTYKRLKFSYSIPIGQLLSELSIVVRSIHPESSDPIEGLVSRVQADETLSTSFLKHIVLGENAPSNLRQLYEANADVLVEEHPHALYPTSVYRTSFGHTTATPEGDYIEAVMGTSVTTTIRVVRDTLSPSCPELRDIYKPLGRCVAVVDQSVNDLYAEQLDGYFESHNISLHKLVYRCMEVDKDISTVQKILVDLKSARVSRNEPVLIMGGGVIADVGGFACALYHRNTPYVMLCTSIVSGIDAGPSPRTCSDGLGYKNVFGAYHPPILTLTDRSFFRTLRHGWIRHGISEIIKMAVTKDASLFNDLEVAGSRLVNSKFGIDGCTQGSEFDKLSDIIIGKAMHGYVAAEYGNMWETHQCRPHAYGHTWSPGFELPAGLLHGHAVSIGMGYGAYLSYLEGWLPEKEFHRILRLMSTMGLALRHNILEDIEVIWEAQVKMTEKRGGNLCAPVPKHAIGTCAYINNMSRERLEKTLVEYQDITRSYPREGLGIEPECADVGLEDPSTVKEHATPSVRNNPTDGTNIGDGTAIDEYNSWVAAVQQDRSTRGTSAMLGTKNLTAVAEDTVSPPTFEPVTLFHKGVEEYASAMTSAPSADFERIAEETSKADLFMPCMVGRLEGQFLSMITKLMRARRVLDIGTFTGYSALAFAEAVGEGGAVVSVEADAPTAAVARQALSQAEAGHRVDIIEGSAKEIMEDMRNREDRFDIVFLDADKVNYEVYYEIGLDLMEEGGVLMADNALCSLVYDEGDKARQSLHEFAQKVRADARVEQVMVTVREGVLMVRKL